MALSGIVFLRVTFHFQNTLRVAIALLFLQMVGAFVPLVIPSDVTFCAITAAWVSTAP